MVIQHYISLNIAILFEDISCYINEDPSIACLFILNAQRIQELANITFLIRQHLKISKETATPSQVKQQKLYFHLVMTRSSYNRKYPQYRIYTFVQFYACFWMGKRIIDLVP